MDSSSSQTTPKLAVVVLATIFVGLTLLCFSDSILIQLQPATLSSIEVRVTKASALGPLRSNSAYFSEHQDTVLRLGNTSYCDCIRRSQLASEECGFAPYVPQGDRIQFLVTGTGRSGTQFLQAELKALGLRVGHDTSRGKYQGFVAWPEAFSNQRFVTHDEEGKMVNKTCLHPSWNYSNKFYLFYHAFHLVRHPLKTIRSRYNMGRPSSFQFPGFCNTLNAANKTLPRKLWNLGITMKHWVLWNSFVEQYAEARFKIEDLDSPKKKEIITYLIKASELVKKSPSLKLNEITSHIDTVEVPTTQNSQHTRKSHVELTWAQLANANREFTALAQIQSMRYGYDVDPAELLPEVWDECDATRMKVQRCYFLYHGGQWTCKLFSEACSTASLT